MMIALGEMATLFPVAGGFTHYATRFIDPAMGFALGEPCWDFFELDRALTSWLLFHFLRIQLLVQLCYHFAH